jgi:hypothetical protein
MRPDSRQPESTLGAMSDPDEESLPAKLGIKDRASGISKAVEARKQMTSLAARAFGQDQPLDVPRMTMMSLLTRAQAFHDGAIDSALQDNPFATFTLLRSYAENAAVLIWISEKQGEVRRLYPNVPAEFTFSIGKLVAFAGKVSPGFNGIYEQLSGFAHPSAASALSSWKTTESPGHVDWASKPRFKNDDDFMIACAWLVELADANGKLWANTWNRYFGPHAEWDAPDW